MNQKQNANAKWKVIGILLLVTASLTFGAIFYAYKSLNPAEIKKIVKSQIETIFPNASVEMDDIHIGLGFNFKLSVANFHLRSRSKEEIKMRDTSLLKVNELSVKIPFWAILTNGGTIEVQLNNPQIEFVATEKFNNWTYALNKHTESEHSNAKDQNESKDPLKTTDTKSNDVLNHFLKNNKINLRLKNLNLLSENARGEKQQIIISKFLINDLNFEAPTAYEVASMITMENQNINATNQKTQTEKLSFNLLAIGQLYLSDYLKDQSLKLDSVVKVSDFQKTSMNLKLPVITTQLKMAIDRDFQVNGQIEVSFENQNKLTTEFQTKTTLGENNVMSLTQFHFEFFMKDLLAIQNPGVPGLDVGDSKIIVKGDANYFPLKTKKIGMNFQYELTPGLTYNSHGLKLSSVSKGSLTEENLNLFLNSKVMDGNVDISVKNLLNLNELMNAPTFELGNLTPIVIGIDANKVVLSEEFIREKLWGATSGNQSPMTSQSKNENDVNIQNNQNNQDTQNEQVKDTHKKGSQGKIPSLPMIIANVNWKGISVANNDFSGSGKITFHNQVLDINPLKFRYQNGSGQYVQKTLLKKASHSTQFQLNLTQLNLESFKSFLPPFIENFTGTMDGTVKGDVTLFASPKNSPQYLVELNGKLKNGEIKKLNLSEYVNPVLKGIPVVKEFYKEDKEISLDGNYEELTLVGNFSDKNYILKEFKFIGINKKAEIIGTGNISPMPNGQSSIEATLSDNSGKVSEILQKNTGSKILPLKLTGLGYSLKPEVGYTVSKLSKGVLKTKGEEKLKEVTAKLSEKIKENAAEKIKDIFKKDQDGQGSGGGAKEKVNSLLKGLFKK